MTTEYGIPGSSVSEIVEGLTEAERGFVLALPSDRSWTESGRIIARLQMAKPNALRGFGKSGLIEGYYKETTKHRLTAKGQEVRTHLLSLGEGV